VILPSEYSGRYHQRLLGLDGPVIPNPIPLDRVVAENTEPKYVTFINPVEEPKRCRERMALGNP
jgi:hypothetical protein